MLPIWKRGVRDTSKKAFCGNERKLTEAPTALLQLDLLGLTERPDDTC